ncbi:MAG: thioredoxin family protein [Acidobacteria bacterium]|nr:thioredoxin family protein [Acidobacteriota bacterium]MBI3488167.1 thioredoxin family protein [Acidobacteriota bacterium]
MTLIRFLACLGILSCVARPMEAFEPDKDVRIAFKKGAVVITVPTGAHLKKSFTGVILTSKSGHLEVGPLPKADAKDELDEDIYHGTIAIPVAGQGLAGEVSLDVQYQPCTEGTGGTCFPPTTQSLKVNASDIPVLVQAKAKATSEPAPRGGAPSKPVDSVPGAPRVEETVPVAAPVAVVAPGSAAAHSTQQGLAALLAIAFLAGLGASLTPCVYPMIPITMAIIGTKGGGKIRGFLLSLSLVLGMAVTYTALGTIAALSGATFGSFAQKPAFLIPVSILFALFALSLFGWFEIDLPQSLKARLQGDTPRKGFGGALVMGLVLGPLAAPCVGPIVASILVGIAKQGQVFAGGLQLFVFALGMGVLFMAVGTFSSALPRSGDWLTRLKSLMGVVVLGFAAWNIRLLAPEWLNAAMWMAVLFVAAVVLGAFRNAEELGAGLQKALGLSLLTVGLLLGVKAVESGLEVSLLPKADAGAKTEARAPSVWIENDLEAAQKKAKAEGKLLLIDTYTSWCAQCKELDHKTWPDPQIAAWIKANAVAVRVDCEKGRPDLQKILDIKSYPTIILRDAEGRELRRQFGFQPANELFSWLKRP